MNYFSLIIHALVLYSVIHMVLRKCTDRALVPVGWISVMLKMAAGLLLGWLYLDYYGTGDTFGFHEEASRLVEYAWENPWNYVKYLIGVKEFPLATEFERMPRALFMVKMVSVVHLVTGSNYWISSLYFSLFSWLGMWVLAVRIATNFPKVKFQALLAALFIPSFVFWGSGLTKESVAAGAFGFILAFFIPPVRRTAFRIVWVIIMLLILWEIKYYYVVPLAMGLILAYVWDQMDKFGLRPVLKIAAFPVVGLILFGFVSNLNPNFNWNYFPEMILMNYTAFIDKSETGTFIEYSGMCGEWICLARSFPEAVFTALYRPFFWDATSVVQWIAAIENLVLLLLLIPALLRFRSYLALPDMQKNQIIGAWVFVLSLAGFLALATPNFGSLQRYGFLILPVYVFILTCTIPANSIRPGRIFGIDVPLRLWKNR